MNEGLIIDLQSPPDHQRTDCLLNAPPFGEKDESFGELRAFYDLDNVLKPILYTVDEPSLVPSIDDDRLNSRAEADKSPSKWERTVLILNISRCNIHGEKASVNIDCKMSLAAQHLFRGVVAPISVGSVAFH